MKNKYAALLFRTFSLVLLPLLPLHSFADVSVIKKNNLKNTNVEYAKIVYIGEVTEGKTVDVMSSLDEINALYPNVKRIYFYINSYGGDMDSGYMTYEAVKSSPTPITTVNMSMVASAATLFYCAASERQTMSGSSFILHPAAASNSRSNYLKPDEVNMLQQMNNTYNNMFDTIYQRCTSYTDDERKKILYSESTRELINAKQALEKKMATAITEKTINVDVSYYITEKETH
ncbi:ATP-dependent Clp protease proteolytic subunit [Brenneria sp. 4F2]|nr:ATP-dependent Clp protease proteolytic subunit [Brenneria bubanii]